MSGALALLRGALLERVYQTRSLRADMQANANLYAASSARTQGDALWSSVLESLRGKLSGRRLDELRSASYSPERTPSLLRVVAQRAAVRSWVHDGRLSLLDAAVTDRTDGGVELAVIPAPGPLEARDPTRSFERFLPNAANQTVLERLRRLTDPFARAATADAAGGAGAADSLVILCGSPGSGKTHLLHALADRAQEQQARVLITSGEALTLGLVTALRHQSLEEFRTPLRHCDLLLIDDLQSLIEREATQEELAKMLSERFASSRTTVVSSRIRPESGCGLRPALLTSLQQGVLTELCAPEWETRVAVILERSAQWGVEAQPEVASLLARSLGASLARLDAVLTRLMTHPACASGLVDQELVQRILETGGPLVTSARPQDVIRLISRHFSVRPSELRSPARSPRITTPRQLAMYLLRHHCGLSYPEIGQRFRRHHTTAMHACRRIEQQRDRSAGLRATVFVLEKELLRLSEGGE